MELHKQLRNWRVVEKTKLSSAVDKTASCRPQSGLLLHSLKQHFVVPPGGMFIWQFMGQFSHRQEGKWLFGSKVQSLKTKNHPQSKILLCLSVVLAEEFQAAIKWQLLICYECVHMCKLDFRACIKCFELWLPCVCFRKCKTLLWEVIRRFIQQKD